MRSAARRVSHASYLALGAILATLVLTVGLTGAAPAQAATGTPIVGVASGRCLDVTGNVKTTRTRVIIWDCNGQANQAWTLTAAGELRVYDGARCLDVRGSNLSPGGIVQTYTCTGGANQKWRVNADQTIVGVQSGLCLDVTGGSPARGAYVQTWTCHGGGNQKWRTSFGGSDTTPPSVPGSPRVSNLTCSSVSFAWNASTDNVGVIAYDVYHDGQQMTSVSGTTLSTTLTVVPGATWGLYVNARDAAGNVSQASTTVTITPPPCQTDTQPPSAPTGLTATASGTTVTLSWTAATDNVGVRAYDVYRGGSKVGSVTGTDAVPPTTSFVDSGLTASTTYTYAVAARDAAGNVSPQSAPVTVTTGSGCGQSVCGVTQVATDTDIPWGLLTLPDGSVLYSRRDARDIIRLDPATGAKTTVGTVPNVAGTDGEGGLMGLAISSELRRRPLALHHAHVAHGQPDRADQAQRADPGHRVGAGAGVRHPAEQVPQRWPAPVRPGRQAVRVDRRRPERRQRPEPQQPQRQDPADQPGRDGPVRQPVRQLRLELRPPQPAGPGLRLAGPAVGAGVRQLGHGRDQPHHQGRQLRLAGVRGDVRHVRHAPDTSRRSTRTRRPRAPAPGSPSSATSSTWPVSGARGSTAR